MNVQTRWWHTMPFLRLIIPLLGGIFFYTPGKYYPIWVSLCSILLLVFFIFLLRKRGFYRVLFLKGALLHLILFVSGYMLCYMHDARNRQTWFGRNEGRSLIIRLSSATVAGRFYQTATADVVAARKDTGWRSVSGSVKVRLPMNTNLSAGSFLMTNRKPDILPDTGRWAGYTRYLGIQNIYHQLKLNKDDILILHRASEKPDLISKMQHRLLLVIDKYFPAQDIRGLAKALLVGYRGELDPELNLSYTRTGVVHVIAISGLHLGLIYSMLMLLFSPLNHIRFLRIISGCCCLLLLWLFTFICGATPSVVRSAVMFSFLITGNIIRCSPVTGNMLAASAFSMLSIQPMLIFDIGFQLSYGAVGSLLVYSRPIGALFSPSNGLLKLGWSSISTSLAAQVLTTPLILYHFHQFPLLFLLANLVAIPLSSFALLLLLLLCLLSPFPPLASCIAILSGWVIGFMNERIQLLSALPFSTWENIPFTTMALLFSLLSIGILTLFLRQRTPASLYFLLSTLILWSLLHQYSSG